MSVSRLSLLLTGILVAQPAAGQTVPAGGSELFRFALHQKGLTPRTTIPQPHERADDTVIIVFGDARPMNDLMPGLQLRSFVARGGALLIATDSPSSDPRRPGIGWAGAFEIEVTGQHLQTAAGRGYQGSATRPYVRSLPDGFKFLRKAGPSPFDLFADLPDDGPAAVATDRPSEMRMLRKVPGFVDDGLAAYPRGVTRIRDGRRVQPGDDYFAISLRHGESPGRALFMADHSVFVNRMLGFREDPANPQGYTFDNGNWQLANRTIDWLVGGGPQPRTKCLFIENGHFVKQFAVELPPGQQPPMPDLPPELIANWLLNHADPILDEYQKKDAFNKFFDNRPALTDRLIRYLLIGLSILFALGLLRRLVRGYRKPEARPLPTAVSEGMLPRRGIVWQRTDAQLEVGNLYEAARRRVRDRFDRLGGAPGPHGEMPPVLVANDIRDGELLRSAVAWLWPIGYGDVPVPVPPTEWDRVNALLERLTRRAAAGDWSFGAFV